MNPIILAMAVFEFLVKVVYPTAKKVKEEYEKPTVRGWASDKEETVSPSHSIGEKS